MKYHIIILSLFAIVLSGCVALPGQTGGPECYTDSDCSDYGNNFICDANGDCYSCPVPTCERPPEGCSYVPDDSERCPGCGKIKCIEPNEFQVGDWVDAEDGKLVNPMKISGDGTYIFTPTGSTSSSEGSASYTFNVAQQGNYVLNTRVQAIDSNSDSFFVGLENENARLDSNKRWDIEESNSWTNDYVNWVGVSDPKVWALGTGKHTFVFYGRESNAKLDKIKLEKYEGETPPTCNDNKQNQGETGIDCGGPCSACPSEPTCTDGIQNQGETGIDCGGPCKECVPSGEIGFITIDSNYPNSFKYENGERFFPFGDTAYYLMGESKTNIQKYIDSRSEAGYNFIRFGAVGPGFWPLGGTPSNPDFTKIDETDMQKLDWVFDYAKSKDMNIELIIWLYGDEGGNGMWGNSQHENFWVDTLVNRYKNKDNLFMWTVANEFERYPNGQYSYVPADSAWAKEIATRIRSKDSKHPIGVHAYAGLYDENKLTTWQLWENSDVNVYNVFSRTGHIEEEWTSCPTGNTGVMMYETNWEGKTYTPIYENSGWKFEAPGLEDGVAEDWSHGKPIIVTEFGYQVENSMDSNHPNVAKCQLYHPETLRKTAWKTVTSGGYLATGYVHTVKAIDPSKINIFTSEHFEILYNFVTKKTEYWKMKPELGKVAKHNSLLAKIGIEYLAYFPQGGTNYVELSAGKYDVVWLNPRTGAETNKGEIYYNSGRNNFAPPSETNKDWTLHLKNTCSGTECNTNPEPEPTGTIISDSLQGSTKGQKIGGTFTSEGYKPGKGENHIFYEVDQMTEGYVEFEIKGFHPNDIGGENNDHAFIVMYDGRGISEPVTYDWNPSSDQYPFRDNFNRWNYHWRQNKGVFKCVVNLPADTSERRNAEVAHFGGEERDWVDEPSGKAFSWDSNKNTWYKMKLVWKDRHFKAYIDNQLVWENDVAAINDYSPVKHRIWLGSGPGKYDSDVSGVIYKNFKLVKTK